MTTNRKKRLNTEDMLDVDTYLRKNRDIIDSERPSYSEVARRISEELKIPCSSGIVHRIARKRGLNWEPSGTRKRAKKGEVASTLAQYMLYLVGVLKREGFDVIDNEAVYAIAHKRNSRVRQIPKPASDLNSKIAANQEKP